MEKTLENGTLSSKMENQLKKLFELGAMTPEQEKLYQSRKQREDLGLDLESNNKIDKIFPKAIRDIQKTPKMSEKIKEIAESSMEKPKAKRTRRNKNGM